MQQSPDLSFRVNGALVGRGQGRAFPATQAMSTACRAQGKEGCGAAWPWAGSPLTDKKTEA